MIKDLKYILVLFFISLNQFSIAGINKPAFFTFDDSSEVRFYYVSGSEHGIWLARKDDSGNWTRGQKVMLDNAFEPNAVDPDIIRLNDGRYRIYYFKGWFTSPPPPNEPNKIYSAVSTDGINFTVEDVVFQLNNITDPTVVQLPDSTYLMALAQHAQQSTNIIFAKSIDGVSFHQTTTITNAGIPELALLNDGSLRVYYNKIGGIGSHRSTDNGNSWVAETGLRLSAMFFVGDPSVIKVNDNQWLMFVKGFNNTGLSDPRGHNVRMAESNDGNTFTLVGNVLIDSASVPEGVLISLNSTNVKENITASSEQFILYQNYPNPFNPITTIKYSIHISSLSESVSKGSVKVILVIYDMLGKEAATLVNKEQVPGEYVVQWDASSFPAGIYFCRFSMGNNTGAKKLLLLK